MNKDTESILYSFREIPYELHGYYMAAAEDARKMSHNGEGTRTGAVVININDAVPEKFDDMDKKILGRGSNTLPYEMTPGLQKMIADRKTDFYHDALQHAERNAIHNVIKKRGPKVLQTGAMYASLSPCSQCAWEIIASGIKIVISPQIPDFGDKNWGKNWMHSMLNLEMGGVKYVVWPAESKMAHRATDLMLCKYLWAEQMAELWMPLEIRLESHARRLNDNKNYNIDALAKLLQQARG